MWQRNGYSDVPIFSYELQGLALIYEYRNSNNFPTGSVHALATFVINCFPEAKNISSSFGLAVKAFIRKEPIEGQELRQWNNQLNQLNWEFIKNFAKKIEDLPHWQGSWTTIPDHSNSDLMNFIKEALA